LLIHYIDIDIDIGFDIGVVLVVVDTVVVMVGDVNIVE
jgi:hypothetical protein